MTVVALIPALNEGLTIGEVVRGVCAHVSKVVVVSDGSTDDTIARARGAGATVLAHAATAGKGQAVRTGLEHALADASVEFVVILDGDLQHLPSEAPRLLEAARRTGADLVVGERQFDRRSMPRARYYANVIGSWALSAFIRSTLRDTQCGFRVLRADMLRRLPLRARGYDIETEMLVKVARLGGRIVPVPVTAVYGGGASKLRPLRDTTRTCFRAVYYRYLERL
jgi:glycosyltransferase involved in cell wall biosynthesis